MWSLTRFETICTIQKREKHPWRSVNFRLKSAILLKITLLHGCFSCFLNGTNGTKSRNASHIPNRKHKNGATANSKRSMTHKKSTLRNLFQPSVAFHIHTETC